MKKDILRFNVAVDYITIMHELNSMTDLLYYTSYFLLWKSAFTAKVIVHISTTTKLKD